MKIDSFEPTMNYGEYIESENRFAILKKVNPGNTTKLIRESKNDAEQRRKDYLDKKS